ncbi:uncharacterized protein C8R40DRAFT_296217 [Lentinula edodes]|uniref:uncharacterized protein n=1 Tax=Lentinula edodes TaxID=5353 RepID=UPI001E8E4E79|nr:uncharacterized protein C8R40DRAFT_296217 [Lentinula edodes]KAH7874660.1 hypothetical protein C8R40DRAFT_296217 [Lentinula edodes]
MLASTQISPFPSRTYNPSLSPSSGNQPDATRRASLFDTASAKSPLRQRPLFPPVAVEGRSHSDFALKSPYKTPVVPAWSPFASNSHLGVDDDEASVLLGSPSATTSPLFAASMARSLFTPVKQAPRVVDGLSPTPTVGSPSALRPQPSTGTSLKRKSVSTRQSTPLRQHSLTPLDIASTGLKGSTDGRRFDRLAPLPAPKFPIRTPQTKKETDPQLRQETATMTRLRISDLNEFQDEFEGGNDSGCDLGCDLNLEDDKARGDELFLGGEVMPMRGRGKVEAALRLAGKGKFNEEVAEAVSPGGHIIKRRARARPLSDELLSSTVSQASATRSSAYTGLNAVTFPTGASQFRDHASPSSSSSESGSPMPRRRASGLHPSKPPVYRRAQLNRVDSATLFFGGPAVTAAPSLASPSTSSRRVTTSISSDAADSPFTTATRPKILNRHSYSGSGPVTPSWRQMHPRSNDVSPTTSPPLSYTAGETESYDTDDDDSMMVDLPANSSFVLNITEDTPSPKRIGRTSEQISKKYTRDSGIALSDDDEDMEFVESSTSSERLSTMPRASTSVSSLYSDIEDGLVTPGVGPRSSSAWPDFVIVNGPDDGGCDASEQDVDAFILRTLAAAAKSTYEAKKAPGTPVKKSKVSYLARQRPWQSAMTHKVGFGAHAEEKMKKVPRKSMPASFPLVGRKHNRSVDPDTDSESDCDDSPSNRKEKYIGLGIGIPSLSKNGVSRNRWLMRRSSSGAFSSSSESAGTPTRNRPLGDCLRPSGSPHLSKQTSPTHRSKLSPARSASSSSNGSVTSPSILRQLPIAGDQKYRAPRFSTRTRRLSQPSHQQRPGRFEQQFVEIAEVGSGEFGKVLKVRTKDGNSDACFAVKKSKRFEGVKHRLRLREEVDTLQHLSHVTGGCGHPNILAFIDAWEEDEQLFIWTELCEGGNFAHFLWEYGRVFPRLDQARVWKIIVELSNGLKFIHDSGVIHLDLKPANIFLTGEGRFKIGDFGMASLWPRPRLTADSTSASGSFEREGDKLYLAPEVLQGKYGKAADMFSFGMTILETASNIVVPDQGEAWHRLRQEDFSQVDLKDSPELLRLVQQMMRTNPSLRVGIHGVYNHPIVARARMEMERIYDTAKRAGTNLFAASPLASVSEDFLPVILNV